MQFAKNLKRFRLVTFDITDTLLSFREEPSKIYAQAAVGFGYKNIDEQKLKACFRENFKAMAEKYPNYGCLVPNMTWQSWWLELVKNSFRCSNPKIDETRMNDLAEHLIKVFRTKACWQKIDCCENFLQKVHELDVAVGCISNFDPSLRHVLDEMNILSHFDFVITSYDAKIQKPENQIFNLALKQAGVADAGEALHIGNSLELDFMAARNAGWSSLLVAKNTKETSNVKPDLIYENICDMLKALDTKNIEW